MKQYKALPLVLFFLATMVSADAIVYITDQVDIPIRSDKAFGDNIIRSLPSGTELSILQITDNNAWHKSNMKILSVGLLHPIYLKTHQHVKS